MELNLVSIAAQGLAIINLLLLAGREYHNLCTYGILKYIIYRKNLSRDKISGCKRCMHLINPMYDQTFYYVTKMGFS